MAEAECRPASLMRDRGPAVLESKEAFFTLMSRFVANECQDDGVDSISFLLAQIKQIVNLFQDMGLCNLMGVYSAIVQHTNTTFEHHSGWKICSISGIPSRKTLYIDDNTFVSTQYEKWVHCVWLAAHMSMLERSRRHERHAVKRIAPADADVYRRAFKCVFDSFLDAYAALRCDRHSRVCRWGKKNNAIDARGAGGSANDDPRRLCQDSQKRVS